MATMSRLRFALMLGLAVGAPAFIYWQLIGYHTNFASGFSEARFAQLVVGDTRLRVLQLLGQPLKILSEEREEEWCYEKPGSGALTLSPRDGVTIDVTEGEWCVRFALDGLISPEFRQELGGISREELRDKLGAPAQVWPRGVNERFVYSEPSRPQGNWEWREVVIQAGRVQRLTSLPVNE